MCLAIPGMVKEILQDKYALVDFLGVEKKISIDLIEDVRIGEFVIVHAGYAISKVRQEEALGTIKHLKQLCADMG